MGPQELFLRDRIVAMVEELAALETERLNVPGDHMLVAEAGMPNGSVLDMTTATAEQIHQGIRDTGEAVISRCVRDLSELVEIMKSANYHLLSRGCV